MATRTFSRAALLVFALLASRLDAASQTADALFDGSALNDVWVRINARDWEELHTHYREGTYYPIDFEWNGVRIRNAGIRVRGNSTRYQNKPSFRIDFNRYVDGQDLFGHKALVLNNGVHDPSLLHDELSMRLFRAMGIPAPRQAHVRLYVGPTREYAGVYVISEEIDKAFLRANLREDSGYLYEFHHQDGEIYGFQDPGPDLGWYVPRFGPKTHETESVATLYTPIRRLVEAVNDARPSELEDKLSDFLDLDTFITELAVQTFLSQTDGIVGGVGMNNFYLYRFNGKRVSMLIPWDQDNSFDSVSLPPWWNLSTNVLTAKIWDEPKYRNAYLAKLMEIAAVVSTGALEQDAARHAAQLRESVYHDPVFPFSREDYDASTAWVTQFLRERPAAIRQFVRSVAPEVVQAASFRTRLSGTRPTLNPLGQPPR